MIFLTRIAWRLGNAVAQIAFAYKHGRRKGYALRPGTAPKIFSDKEWHD